MELVRLKSSRMKRSGNMLYRCSITDGLKEVTGLPKEFYISGNLSQGIVRIQYNDKSIGDFILKKKNELNYEITKFSLYTSNLKLISHMNSEILNNMNSYLKSFENNGIICY